MEARKGATMIINVMMIVATTTMTVGGLRGWRAELGASFPRRRRMAAVQEFVVVVVRSMGPWRFNFGLRLTRVSSVRHGVRGARRHLSPAARIEKKLLILTTSASGLVSARLCSLSVFALCVSLARRQENRPAPLGESGGSAREQQ